MTALRYSLLIFFSAIVVGACGRSDLIRMRLLVPVGEAKKDHAIVTDQTSASSSKSTVNDPKTSGGSFYFLSRSLGLGYTTLTTNIEKEVRSTSNDSLILREKTTLETKFTDVAFGIGENYSLMWGAGILSGGKLDTSLFYSYSGATDETLKHDKLAGHSLFMVFGHHGSGFETLLGIRTNYIKADLKDSGSSAETLRTASSISYDSTGIRLTTTQVQLGIGVTF